MLEVNRRAINQALEDMTNSTDPGVKLDLAVQWIDYYRQHGSAGFIREDPPHVAQPPKLRVEPILTKEGA